MSDFILIDFTVMLSDQTCNFFRHGCFPHYLGHSVLVQGKPMCKPKLARKKLLWMSWSRGRLNILEEQRTENRTCLQRIPRMRNLYAVKCFHHGDDLFYSFTRHMCYMIKIIPYFSKIGKTSQMSKLTFHFLFFNRIERKIKNLSYAKEIFLGKKKS